MPNPQLHDCHALPHAQRGVATLGIALILLLAITLVTFSSARVSVVEQRIAANDYRAKQALHAAQAALERAVYSSNIITPALSTTYTNVLPGSTATTPPCTAAGICYSYVYTSVLGGTPVNTVLLRVTATGYSDDGSASKTVTQYVKKFSPLPNIPNTPIKTGGSYDSNSNAINIVNNITSSAIEAQGTIDTQGKTITSVDGVAGAGLVPNTTTTGVTGVVDTEPEREAFFNGVFGTSKTEVKNLSQQVDCSRSSSCPALANIGGKPPAPFLWVTGNIQLTSMTIGTPTNPVVLVVNGTLDLRGGTIIYGFVYVTGNVADDDPATVVGGNANITGSLVSEGDLNFRGTADVTYNQFPDPNGGPRMPNFYVKVPGTWTN